MLSVQSDRSVDRRSIVLRWLTVKRDHCPILIAKILLSRRIVRWSRSTRLIVVPKFYENKNSPKFSRWSTNFSWSMCYYSIEFRLKVFRVRFHLFVIVPERKGKRRTSISTGCFLTNFSSISYLHVAIRS